VIVDDLPALLCVTQNQRESSVRLVVGPPQLPATQDQGSIVPQRCDFQVGKSQGAHLLAGVIVLLITVEDWLPATSDVVSGNEVSAERE
jgi:hypothetical protein